MCNSPRIQSINDWLESQLMIINLWRSEPLHADDPSDRLLEKLDEHHSWLSDALAELSQQHRPANRESK